MDFYKGLSKGADIFFTFGGRINESNRRENRKGLIDSIRSFKKINYLYPYLIN